MIIEKCLYYNDHQTAVTLMLDDLSFTATSLDGTLHASIDWGYGLNNPNSLYRYFTEILFSKYPELKGTVFIPLARHMLQNINAGYHVLFNDCVEDIRHFIRDIEEKFELAFHGIGHGRYKDEKKCAIEGNWEQEFAYLRTCDIDSIKTQISVFESFFEVKLLGGKYPGYAKSAEAARIVEALGFKWWAADCGMINRKCGANRPVYFGIQKKILAMPTNISGDAFSHTLRVNGGFWRNLLRSGRNRFRNLWFELYLQYLYESRQVISIQEHFQNLRTDGKRQTPNIYDDILSLDRIFGILRGADIWYATCGDIAHYIESYDHTNLIALDNGCWEIQYNGSWNNHFLSVKSKNKFLQDIKKNQDIQGVYKQGEWIFNNIQRGIYRELESC